VSNEQPLTLSPKQAAPMVPMGINQFYAAVRQGEVPSIRIGRKIRIPRKAFLNWLNGQPQDAA
jgi:excisionase family DNA binding protein